MKNETIKELGEVKPVVVIGGKTGKFVPNLNMSFHDDEFFINLNREDKIITDETAEIKNFKTVLSGNDNDIFHVNENGEFKWDIELKEKPESNVFKWELKHTQGIEFYYQGALTVEEIAEGCERPDKVVGSYAVYCNKANNKYKTGKLCHIYRPFCYDAKGNTIYADLKIKDGYMTITIPQEYLDDAVYPVCLDPTFGYTSAGVSYITAASTTQPRGTRYGTYLAVAGDVINSYHVRALGASSSSIFELSAYTYSAGELSGRMESGVNATLNTTAAWYSVNTNLTLSAETYTLASAFSAVDGTCRLYYDSGTGYGNRHTSAGALPSTWTPSTNYDYIFSLYATYTESSGGAVDGSLVGQSALVGGGVLCGQGNLIN